MNYIILTAGVLNLFIGFLALRNSRQKKEIVLFSVFCFITSIWTILNFFLGYFKQPLLVGPIYAAGTFVSASLLSWTYVYVKKGNSFWKHFIIFTLAGAIAFFSLATNWIIADVYGINASGLEIKEGVLFPLFGIFLAGSVIFALIKIFLAYRREKNGDEKRSKKLVLIGVGGFTGFSILVSSILPMFGFFNLTNLDSPSTLIFVLFASIAIFKYRFLRIKVIVAHLLAAMMIVFSAVEIFYAQTSLQFAFRIALFIVFFAVGVLLAETINSEVRRKKELEIANIRLKHLDDAKTEFISIASHQLRTPLTAIKGFAGLILDGTYGKLDPQLAETVDEIAQSNQRLMDLVEDLLNVSKIESGKINLAFEKTDIREICQVIGKTFLLKAKEKNIRLEYRQPKNIIPKILVDRKTLTEGVSNVVDNAIKYTETGKVTMEIIKNKKSVIIVVSDTGIGIERDQFIHLFSKFSRGANAVRHDISGTGLGLYVAKSMIEKNGGTIHAESVGENKGSKFIIEIPIK